MAHVQLVWFRRDLRLADHPALLQAVKAGGAVVPVYIWSPEEQGEWAPGSASRWWLNRSLEALDARLRAMGSRLILRRGPAAEALHKLADETGAAGLYFHHRYEPFGLAQQDAVVERLSRQLSISMVHGNLFFPLPTILTSKGKPYRHFTPFWKALRPLLETVQPLPAPKRIPAPAEWPASEPLAALRIDPGGSCDGLEKSWKPGEEAAQHRLRKTCQAVIENYAERCDRADLKGTSMLSPYLHTGELSLGQVSAAALRTLQFSKQITSHESVWAFVRRLALYKFATLLLYHFPEAAHEPMDPNFKRFNYRNSPGELQAWKEGRTGYPLVDAGMRQLKAQGWIHKRVRMAVASFLVKDLMLPWQEGVRHFWEHLVDADLANAVLGWQWVAGCGAETNPYTRMLSPVVQSRRYDPEGFYIRSWVPELKYLPKPWIFKPWEAPKELLQAAGVELGRTYPAPIVKHSEAAARALAEFKRIRAFEPAGDGPNSPV